MLLNQQDEILSIYQKGGSLKKNSEIHAMQSIFKKVY